MIFRPLKAMQCFECVMKLTKKIPDAFLELAVLYERRHRVEEALTLIEDCLRADPDYLEANLFKARLLRRIKNEPASESLFRKLAANDQAHPMVRAQAWAELAQMHDRREEYEEAMQAMLQCKQILLPHEAEMRQEADRVLRHLRGLAASLTAEHFQRWAQSAQQFPTKKVAVL